MTGRGRLTTVLTATMSRKWPGGPRPLPPARRGRAVSPASPPAKDAVCPNMIEGELRLDPDRLGVAVVIDIDIDIDIDIVQGAGPTGRFEQRGTHEPAG